MSRGVYPVGPVCTCLPCPGVHPRCRQPPAASQTFASGTADCNPQGTPTAPPRLCLCVSGSPLGAVRRPAPCRWEKQTFASEAWPVLWLENPHCGAAGVYLGRMTRTRLDPHSPVATFLSRGDASQGPPCAPSCSLSAGAAGPAPAEGASGPRRRCGVAPAS